MILSDDRSSFTAFAGPVCVANGTLHDVLPVLKSASDDGSTAELLCFDDRTGAVIEVDLRGTLADVLARIEVRPSDPPAPRGRGRPKLGVVSREVTLLPRHWEWLAKQPGGTSQALRRLVDEARRADAGRTDARAAREAAYRFMSTLAGNLPGFEDAARALFADDRDRFREHTITWPRDVRAYAERLAWGVRRDDGA